MSDKWSPNSWKNFEAKQQPTWPADSKLDKVLEILEKRLPLVFSGEIETLKNKMAKAAKGEMFLLQGGDCAERFSPTFDDVKNKLKILLQMNMVLMYGASKPVIKVGRFAGQYAKPRSAATEVIDGQEMPSYFGDIVNKPEPNLKARTPNPKNMLDAYNYSASTINIVRGLSNGGFADLHRVHDWNKEFVKSSPASEHYQEIADDISKSLDFMKACGIEDTEAISATTFFTSHEALLLEYEAALTHAIKGSNKYYDQSGHMVWVGNRTRDLDGAHIEFLRGIENPVGIKVGPGMLAEDAIALIQKLNPKNKEGKINVITRYGANVIDNELPSMIKAITTKGLNVLWSCDPMHENTTKTENGYKTRNFNAILKELKRFFAIHRELGTVAGGVHLELTGEDVTECTGGAEQLSIKSLEQNYATACDPRLNDKQAIEMAFLIASEISAK